MEGPVQKNRLTVIIPIRNESNLAGRLIRIRRRCSNSKIIVVDTSSTPSLRFSELPADVSYFHCPDLSTRGQAMNFGAHHAQTPYLLFLHSDTMPEDGAVEKIPTVLANGSVGGAFLKTYEPKLRLLKWQEGFLNALARKKARAIVGTNGIFVRKDFFLEERGFPNQPICEDVVMAGRIRRSGAWAVLPHLVHVSARRYQRYQGVPRFVKNVFVYSLFQMGVSPRFLAKLYR